MRSGMLWFDNAPRPLEEKVAEAVAHYRRKYGEPNVCYVHPSMLPDGPFQVDGVWVRPLAWVLPQHLWVGEERESVQAEVAAGE